MLAFTDISIYDRQQLSEFMNLDGVIMSDRTFATVFAWSEHYQIKKCIKDGYLFLCSFYGERADYHMPLGTGDFKSAILEIENDAAERGLPYRIVNITPEMKSCFLPDYTLTSDRNNYDYVFEADTLINLEGKHLHEKRYFLHKFDTIYGGCYTFEAPTTADFPAIIEYAKAWGEKSNEDHNDFDFEFVTIKRILQYYDQLGIIGGMLKINGSIVGITFAAKQNNHVVDVMIEKASRTVTGAYQKLNKCFSVANYVPGDLINREEDMGIPGLRQSKTSYYPKFLSEKYFAVRSGTDIGQA